MTTAIVRATAAFVVAAALLGSLGFRRTLSAHQTPPRRFVIDSHQHWRSTPDYIPTLVKTYRARNAMACVLTPIASLDAMMAAAKQYPDVIIPYGYLDVDHPDARAQLAPLPPAHGDEGPRRPQQLVLAGFGKEPLAEDAGAERAARHVQDPPARGRRQLGAHSSALTSAAET